MLVFVDQVGGALASLAASLASSRGLAARAASSAPLEDRPEVRQALAEIGVTSLVAAEPLAATDAAGDRVELGAAPLGVSLYAGPDRTDFGDTRLERLALARISRDKIERWLDAR